MPERVIKEIRYFEVKPENYKGEFDGTLGKLIHDTSDTIYIGQRIARKLNELEFISGEFDHIYINLSPNLNKDEICESHVFYNNRIKYFDFGFSISVFNNLTDIEKDKYIEYITFKVLESTYKNDNEKIQLITKVKSLYHKFGKSLIIRYKTKETRNYLIDLNFQIRPIDDKSKLILEYTDKNQNNTRQEIIDILDYQDLYSLIDKVVVKENIIFFNPKKSHHSEMVAKKYKESLLSIEIKNMTVNKITVGNNG
jgi:hypothetical protein